MHLDIRTPEHEALRATAEAFREHDAQTDAERVAEVIGQYRAGGLGVVGVEETAAALRKGQVDEMLLTATPRAIAPAVTPPRAAAAATLGTDVSPAEVIANELVTHARQTSARVTFIEDPALLAEFGGVAARLRYRL